MHICLAPNVLPITPNFVSSVSTNRLSSDVIAIPSDINKTQNLIMIGLLHLKYCLNLHENRKVVKSNSVEKRKFRSLFLDKCPIVLSSLFR